MAERAHIPHFTCQCHPKCKLNQRVAYSLYLQLLNLPGRMKRQLRLQQVPAEPIPQPIAEQTRRFPFDAQALAKQLRPPRQLGDARRRLIQLGHRSLQLRQILFGQFFNPRRFGVALVLKSDFVSLAIGFSAAIHLAAFCNRSMAMKRVESAIRRTHLPKDSLHYFAALGGASRIGTSQNVSAAMPFSP